MPNMRDLARLAGVSVGTVSLALRGSTRISAATRARVQALADDFGYVPHHANRVPLSGSSRVLGCIIQRHYSPWYARILEGVLEQACRQEYSVMAAEGEQTGETAAFAIRHLLEHRVDGVILAIPGMTAMMHAEALFAARGAGVHLVAVVDVPSLTSGDRVICDLDTSARLMVEHLWQLGHREVAFLGHQQAGEYRLPVYTRCLKQFGLSADRVALVETPREGVDRMAVWLAERPRPTAVITDGDALAVSLLQSAGTLGVRIPQDLSVMGSGNEFHARIYPLVSTVEQYPQRLGEEAVKLLVRRLGDARPPAECEPIVRIVEQTLLKRDTTAPPPAHRLREMAAVGQG